MFKRSLILLLASACSYREPVGSVTLTSDAGSGPDSTSAAIDPANLVGEVNCGLLARGSAIYCVEQVGPPGAVLLHQLDPSDDSFSTLGTLALPPMYAFGAAAQDDDHLYFSIELAPGTNYTPANWGIYAVEKSTLAATEVTAGWVEPIRGLTAADGSVYFTEYQPPGNPPAPHTQLFEVPAAGGTAVQLYDQLTDAASLQTDANYVYIADVLRYQLLAIGRTSPHTVLTLATTGDPVTGTEHLPRGLLQVGSWLYYSVGEVHGSIHRIPRPAAGATQGSLSSTNEVIADDVFAPGSMYATNTQLYWTSHFWGLLRSPINGGAPPEPLAYWGYQGYSGLVGSGAHLYFGAPDDTVAAIAKYHITP